MVGHSNDDQPGQDKKSDKEKVRDTRTVWGCGCGCGEWTHFPYTTTPPLHSIRVRRPAGPFQMFRDSDANTPRRARRTRAPNGIRTALSVGCTDTRSYVGGLSAPPILSRIDDRLRGRLAASLSPFPFGRRTRNRRSALRRIQVVSRFITFLIPRSFS